MRFVLSNGLLFIAMSGILFYQYFFQMPVTNVLVSQAAQLRAPAATSPQLPMPTPTKLTTERKFSERDWKFGLSCKNSEQFFNRKGAENLDSIILNLRKCDKEFPKQIVIENESNGFTATLFALNNSQSKTDAIPLKKGKNIIVIKYRFAKSKKDSPVDVVERLSIDR